MEKWIWALVILVIVWVALAWVIIPLGLLWYVTSSPVGGGGVTCQSRSNNFVVKAMAVSAGAGGVNLTLQNGTGKKVVIDSAVGLGDFSGAGKITGSPVPANGTFTIGGITAPPAGTTFSDGRISVRTTVDSKTQDKTQDFEVLCSGKA